MEFLGQRAWILWRLLLLIAQIAFFFLKPFAFLCRIACVCARDSTCQKAGFCIAVVHWFLCLCHADEGLRLFLLYVWANFRVSENHWMLVWNVQQDSRRWPWHGESTAVRLGGSAPGPGFHQRGPCALAASAVGALCLPRTWPRSLPAPLRMFFFSVKFKREPFRRLGSEPLSRAVVCVDPSFPLPPASCPHPSALILSSAEWWNAGRGSSGDPERWVWLARITVFSLFL